MSRKQLLLAVMSFAVRLTRLTRRHRRDVTVILAPSDPGNVGDRAMLTSVCQNLRGHRVLLSVADGRNEAEAGLDATTVNVRTLFTSAPVAALASAWRAGRALGGADRFLIVGADVMDGGYSAWRSEMRFALAALARRRGLHAAVVNMSWNAAPHPRAITALRQARDVRLVARDAVSAQRLLDEGALDVVRSADVAFLCDAFADPGQVPRQWLDQQRSAGRPVVVVNLNPLVASADRLVELVRPACAQLLGAGTSLLLVAHDARDANHGDSGVHGALVRALSGGDLAVDSCVSTWQATGPAEVREVMRSVSFVISCRMHLIILAATVGVPSIGFEYQGKMTGLFEEHFATPDLVVDAASATAEDVSTLVDKLTLLHEDLAAGLRQRLPLIREKALRNIAA